MAVERPDITPELQKLIDAIAAAGTYSGRPVSQSIMRQLILETRKDGAGVLAPFWLNVLQEGRGPRKAKKSSDLWRRMYAWMDKHGLFTSTIEAGRISEAKGLTWYINKYGNKQFRSKTFIDVYKTARERCIREVTKKVGDFAFQITNDIL